MIGYNEYKDKYRNNSTYKFLNNFIKKNNTNEKMENSLDEINTNILPNKNISNEENKKEDFTEREGLITLSCYYHNNNN